MFVWRYVCEHVRDHVREHVRDQLCVVCVSCVCRLSSVLRVAGCGLRVALTYYV